MPRRPFNPDGVAGPGPAPPPSSDAPLTVSQLTTMIKRAIADHLPTTLHVVGQISNCKRHSSGHLYLTLKDEHSELSCVMWRSAAASLKFQPKDGLEVIASGHVDVFERTGRYQLYVRKLEPRGVGALELAFRQLREKLAAEGLFDPARKKPLPRFPRRIGVVTSPTGAAIRDIIRTLARRFPMADVLLHPVPVQGASAAATIAEAVRLLDRRHHSVGGIDILIVGRGGGSLEELWAFNEEIVARAIFACRIPTISAVGHETDVSISDLVADVRAATPTAAAELATPDAPELLTRVQQMAARLTTNVRHHVDLGRAELSTLSHRPPFGEPMRLVHQREERIDTLADRMSATLTERVHQFRHGVGRCELTLQHIHPRAFAADTQRRLNAHHDRLRWALARTLSRCEQRLASRSVRLQSLRPDRRMEALRERVNRIERRLSDATRHRHALAIARITATAEKLHAMSHRATLARGFTITRRKKGRSVLRDVAELRDGDRLITETASGEVESSVVNQEQMELFDE